MFVILHEVWFTVMIISFHIDGSETGLCKKCQLQISLLLYELQCWRLG